MKVDFQHLVLVMHMYCTYHIQTTRSGNLVCARNPRPHTLTCISGTGRPVPSCRLARLTTGVYQEGNDDKSNYAPHKRPLGFPRGILLLVTMVMLIWLMLVVLVISMSVQISVIQFVLQLQRKQKQHNNINNNPNTITITKNNK